YQSAADLKISLAELQNELASGVRVETTLAPAGRSSKLIWVLALVAGTALGAGAMWWLAVRNAEAYDPGYFSRPLTTYSGIEQDPALSPDGKQVAFSWNGPKQDNFDIYVQQVAGGQALRLTTDTGNDMLPTWSPDGETIAFVRVDGTRSAIYSVPALGGLEHKLFEFQQGYRIPAPNPGNPSSHLSWSPDGRMLAFVGLRNDQVREIWMLELGTREARRISTPPQGWQGDGLPAFSPDGKVLAYVRRRDIFSRAIIFQSLGHAGSPEGSPREMTDYTRIIGTLAWLPNGRSLAVGLNSEVWSTIWRFTPGKGFVALGLNSGIDPSVAMKGQRLAYTSFTTDRNIYRLDGPGSSEVGRPFESCHVTKLIDSTVTEGDVMVSRDGTRLAFTAPRTGSRELFVANADGSNQEALTSMGPTYIGSPRWSPDGRWIAYDRYEQGHSVIYAIRSDGGEPRRLTNPNGSDTRPSWSVDGKWVYFSSNRGGQVGIWKIAWSNPEKAVQVTTDGGTTAFESSDGKELIYRNASGIWSVPVKGGEAKKLIPDPAYGQWAVAGRSIYSLRRDGALSIWVLRLDTGRQFEYVRFPAGLGPHQNGTTLTVSQDEKFIYFAQVDRNESDLMLVENFR
ncbi:MAG: DPP IV N-terminal domain-containing protein, partial [Acidobacteriota bacterium]|nr:DPP IV N-terminal domain-containing protein [Acidobacteriota bacterium]